MPIERVISGGQTGADQAGWRAARRFSIPTGGWMPRGYLTEDGPRPEFADLYGARGHESRQYPPRTKANVNDSQGTLWFGAVSSPGYKCTHAAVRAFKSSRPIMVAYDGCHASPHSAAAEWVRWQGITVLNVAGNRESSAPGIGAWVESYLCEVFRLLGHAEITE